ncbi:polysaccharide pyruvyl transferase [Rodentibacter pneumotropicus]|uniref:Polysaccharide pyruvyl transferase family protein n=1 Tax=Rodentibacter pneumotropicus TaxID=758 RepID=A0AAW5LAQ6_9PAST|nr:polysaccharide pyruvyl transferase family protein [Rodentibacter pneumotropicus]MCQ9120638.1 polysaccharide pyruvyl transferase family protein [Rodentibacter pneumotropicus]OOF68826.1 polysaccharide pyruvyl transferase [Rodentibacter pneumotropicus]
MNSTLVSLKQQLAPIADLIKDKNNVFYFDYPLHLNVGDLLIYHGTEQFFKDHNINVTLKRCEFDLDINEVKQKITPNTTILLHGGGNFGDLYPQHQKIREAMIQHFPNNRIIVLPQTLYFKDQKNLEKSTALFNQHSDCHLLARDERTAEAFKHFSSNVALSPDMAHQLYGTLPTKQDNTGKQLHFLRKDIEASEVEKNILTTLPANSNVKDWEDILTHLDSTVLALSWRISKFANQQNWGWLKNLFHQFWFAYTKHIVKRVAAVFLQNDRVTTTRLHGHIFSCLLEIPNRVCDNAYGKNSGYANLWTKNIDFVEIDKK